MQGITSKCKQTESRGQVQGKTLSGPRGAPCNEKELESQWSRHRSNGHKAAFMNNPASSNRVHTRTIKEIEGGRVKCTSVVGYFNSSHTDMYKKWRLKKTII